MADRFLSLGFPERAETTLNHLPHQSLKPDQRILAAQISLALNKPYMTQANLLGVEGEVADKLRADAKHMTGAHAEAYDLYNQAAEGEAATQTAWLADDWQDLMSADTPVFGPTSSVASASNDPDNRSAGMLARTAAALEESAAARQTLTNLLSADEMSIPELQ